MGGSVGLPVLIAAWGLCSVPADANKHMREGLAVCACSAARASALSPADSMGRRDYTGLLFKFVLLEFPGLLVDAIGTAVAETYLVGVAAASVFTQDDLASHAVTEVASAVASTAAFIAFAKFWSASALAALGSTAAETASQFIASCCWLI